MKLNRWLNGAIPAVGIHISIGAVYAWSVFTNPVMETLGVPLSQVSWVFSIAIFFLGMSAAFLGTIVEKWGPANPVSSVHCFTALV
jgi:OFA family oxalate/formate antiporter-like MFS transporter